MPSSFDAVSDMLELNIQRSGNGVRPKVVDFVFFSEA